ncbi:hypothetical protein PTTG_29930 [Puccinia triticina 1-1 BBBD Race 1]|uniref:Uncharacterized protein n=1 Tax=Puccinia triticina (isolate 1-1 / race 1 (BBBD)) TaxID=630390 RepID=A0A180G1S6_PUCT1|nr:hypothetical protein PTTG_29930 [Puccinia triticina 1-1 BBBD Race 1]
MVEAVRTRPSKRQAEAATLGPHRAPKAKIPRTHAANPVRTRVNADQAVVTNESLDAWRQCLLTMCERVAKQPFLTSHTRATTSNNDALIAFSGPQAPAALLHTNTPLAPTLSGSSYSAGINRGRVKQEPSSVSRPDVHAAPSSRGLQELVRHARASPASNPASNSVQIVKGPTCKKANRPPPVYVGTSRDAISPMPPLLPSPAFNHPDNKPPLNLLSAVPSLANPDNAVVDGQRVPDTPNSRPPCYLISLTYVVESSISDAPDLIALSPTDYLGLSPECNSPPSYLENELDEEPTLPSYKCVLALYDPLAGSDRIDQSLDTVPVSHEQTPPPSKLPLQQDAFLAQSCEQNSSPLVQIAYPLDNLRINSPFRC